MNKICELYEVILRLDTLEECKKVFADLCTPAEVKAMSERFQVMKMVDKKVPYREISKKTGVSTATITRVAHWLHHGKGGYKMMLGRLK